jgi:hypothetical protein
MLRCCPGPPQERDNGAHIPQNITTGCHGCGERLRRGVTHCFKRALPVTRVNFDLGRRAAQQPDALKKRSETQRVRKRAIKNWNPSDLPSWLTRDVYVRKVQPALATLSKSRIRSALGVSEPYSSYIQTGKIVPHRRHWWALAELVGVSPTPPAP